LNEYISAALSFRFLSSTSLFTSDIILPAMVQLCQAKKSNGTRFWIKIHIIIEFMVAT
jgi:hypothetical protein